MRFLYIVNLLLSFLFLVFSGYSQQKQISGTVLNSETGEPVPYAYVKKKDLNRGAITNEDGYFQLPCLPTDTLVISFVSFDKLMVPATFFLENDICLLSPADNELATVQVFADFDFLYDLFDRARKKLQQTEDHTTKTYFSLESSTRDMPVELLECYYNAQTGHTGLMDLKLKNGRVGMSMVDDTYYASLNSTQIISNYNLYVSKNNGFPNNPLHFKKRKLKRLYGIKLIGFNDNIYKIKFTAKKGKEQLFESYIWIDKDSERILKIKLIQKDLRRYPFSAIDEKHSISDLNFELDYSFTNSADQFLEKLEFNYDLLYNNTIHERRMETQGVFLFYDTESTFHLPKYSETAPILSDYDKVVAQPYNERFWEYNEVLSPSKKMLSYRAFFMENGVLLNFEELEEKNEVVFQNRIHPWSEERMFSEDINAHRGYVPQANSMKDYMYTRAVPRSQEYNLVAHIYLDRNSFGDSVNYLSRTLIDRHKSYFYLKKSPYTLCLINLYYDLVEIERLKMMDVLASEYWTRNQSDSIYNVFQKSLLARQKNLLLRTDYGQTGETINDYNYMVKKELGIDNGMLVIQDQFLALDEKGQPLYDPGAMEVYSYADALSTARRYDESIDLLLKAHNNGATDAWIYYALGLNFKELGMEEESCYYLVKSEDLGMYVHPKLITDCIK